MKRINEIWKDIQGYDGIYQISNYGKVKICEHIIYTKDNVLIKVKERIMKTFITRGYEQVILQKNGKSKHYQVHRLIAQSFIPNPENKPQVNHINGIKTDNRLENLEWCTQRENQIHAYKTGLQKSLKGIENIMSKPVIRIDFLGNVLEEYGSTMEAERKTGIYHSNISKCCKGILKKAGGYYWKFKELEE